MACSLLTIRRTKVTTQYTCLTQRAVLYPEALDNVLAELNHMDRRLQPSSAARQLYHRLDQVGSFDQHRFQVLPKIRTHEQTKRGIELGELQHYSLLCNRKNTKSQFVTHVQKYARPVFFMQKFRAFFHFEGYVK